MLCMFAELIRVLNVKLLNGGWMAKSLQSLCKDVIRSTLALRGTNITQKIHMLEYPQALKEALMTADGSLELN